MKIIDIKNLSQPDPYVIIHKGKYYLYCTGINGVPVYESKKLESGWEYRGLCLEVEGQKEFWAPSVIELDGKFYMYYSSIPTDCDDVHMQNIKVAVSDSPLGPFKFIKDLIQPFSIDAHVVKNSEGLFMFYSVNDYEAKLAGTYIVVDKMSDPFTMCNKIKAVVRPELEEEIFQKDRFKKGQDWHTIEGAFYFKADGYHYCMYSANCYQKPTYHIGYAVCNNLSDKLNEIDFVRPFKSYNPLICSDETEQSTGHNSVTEEGGQKYVVYHGRDCTSSYSEDDRTARICRLFAKDGKLTVEKF